MKNIYIIILSLLFISCGDDDPILEPLEAMIITNLEAMTTSGPGQPPAGDFVKFSFAKQTVLVRRIRYCLVNKYLFAPHLMHTHMSQRFS